MDFEGIKREVKRNHHLMSNKVRHRISKGTITVNQVRQSILKGNKRKVEQDERTDGKYVKYTLHWRDWYVVVKKTDRPFKIAVGRLD